MEQKSLFEKAPKEEEERVRSEMKMWNLSSQLSEADQGVNPIK